MEKKAICQSISRYEKSPIIYGENANIKQYSDAESLLIDGYILLNNQYKTHKVTIVIKILAIYTPITLRGNKNSKGAIIRHNPCAHFQQVKAPIKDTKSKLNISVPLIKLP